MKTSGVLLPPASLIGRAPRNAVSSWKSVTTSIPVSLVNCGKSGVIAFDQGWVAPPSVIVWPENCFQSIAALAYIAAASSAKLHRGNIAMPDRAAPAAPKGKRPMPLPASRWSSRWFARPLILGVAVPLMLLAAGGFLGVRYWHERQAASHAVEHSRQVLDTLDRLRANIADLEAERRGYLLTLDPAYLKPYGISDESLRRDGEALQSLVADDPLQSLRAAHLALTVAAKLREIDDIVKTARTSGADPALAMIGTMGEVRSQIDQMMDHERFLLAGWETRADALAQSKTWLIASAVAIVTVFAGAALALARHEARRRRRATDENVQLHSDLEERDTKIRRLFDANIIGIIVWNLEGRILEANDAFLRMTGYDREDLASGRLNRTDLTPAEWQDRDAVTVAELKMVGTVQPFEKEYFRKDGSRLPVLMGGALLEASENQGVSFVLDLSERKRAEYLTRQMFERSSDRISIVGRDYRYQRVNPAFERRWGMPAEMIVGMYVADLLGMESFEQMAKAYLDRCFAGEEVSYADWLTTPLGRRYSAVTYSPLRPESERVEAALVIIPDLTEHMLASEALREAQAGLARVTRLTTLGELTASIAHEVNQPLATVVTFGDACLRLLDREGPRIDKARSAVEQMIRSAKHASDVIERIRALSKKHAFENVRLRINQVIDDIIALIRREINIHSISLRLELGASLPPVEGDRVQLQQVIMNLLMNGIQAMSTVTDRHRELRIRSREHGSDQILVAVEDSRIGIEP